MMKSNAQTTKQHGFFSIGIGMALFAVYGAIAWTIVSINNSANTDPKTPQHEEIMPQVEAQQNRSQPE